MSRSDTTHEAPTAGTDSYDDASHQSPDETVRVCFLINKLAPDGAPTIVLNLVEQARDQPFDFTVCFFGGDDTLRTDFEDAGARVVDFGAVGEFPQFDPRSLPRMLRFFRRTSFDILHCHLPYSQSLGRLVGSVADVDHIVSTQHNVPANYHPIERVAERLTRPLDSRTVAVSEGVQTAFTGESEVFHHDTGRQWSTIPNGIDVDAFAGSVDAADGRAVRQEWGLSDSDPLYLNVARYEPQKRQPTLIEAMGEVIDSVPSAHLLIVGWGSLEASLREKVQSAGLSEAVTVTGRVPEIHGYYAAADAFVSASAFEGLPVTILEAMTAECPVVATDIDGVREVVLDGETGRLVPPDEPTQMAAAMRELADHATRERYGEQGCDRVRNVFTVEQMVSRYTRLYRSLDGRQGRENNAGEYENDA
ncbi:glycosyltransferase [Haloarcula sp. Atlit-120R]|uniref:glycosyltransferase n=1 Tax=Haloarcula sp. Atlit-120R TaxID=2282135 RepID=UPI000EF27D41|nr:glycosyltransferase [Haloarcula sp. Atlit-120R]RLM34459.1 glycosyltransferase [Haloarcula sp. Atlit-120R]